ASTPIRRTAALRHDPFEAELTHLVEQRFAPALEVLHVTNRTAVPQEPAAREKLFQHALARLELDIRQIMAAQVRQVEHLVDQTLGAIRGQRFLQLPEAARAVRLQRDELAVEQRLIDTEIGERVDECREARRPVLAIAAEEPHPPALDAGDQAITVELDLVKPSVAGGRRARARRELRLESPRHRTRPRAPQRRDVERRPQRVRATASEALEGVVRQRSRPGSAPVGAALL